MFPLFISWCKSWNLFSFNCNQFFLSTVQSVTVNSVLQHMCSVLKLSILLETHRQNTASTKRQFFSSNQKLTSPVLHMCCKISHCACVTINQTWGLLAGKDPKIKCHFTLSMNSSRCSHSLLLPCTCRSQAASECFQGWE